MVAWCDASSQNRHDGSSTEGIFICLTTRAIKDGAMSRLTPVFWKSGKIALAWAEFCGRRSDPWKPDELVRSVLGILVTLSTIFDKVDKPYITPRGAQKKIDIELFAIKESRTHTQLQVRWVHSDAQLANTLTKRGE